MRAAVIFNPASGRRRGGPVAGAVAQGLSIRGLEVELHATHGPLEATELARRAALGSDIVVAVGGDGTVNEIVDGLMQAQAAAQPATSAGRPGCTLAVIPAGTVNVLALELKLPFRAEHACDVIAAGKTLSLDLGRANSRHFALMMGAGIDALTVHNIDPQAKKVLKELAFVGTGLKQGLQDRPPEFVVRADGQEHRATFFVASNCRYYAAHLSVTPTADPTDGMLDLMLFAGTTRSSLTAFWLGVPSGLHLRNPHVQCLRAHRAEVVPLLDTEDIWFQTDGEVAGQLPVTVEVLPHALEVLVP